MSTKAPPTRTTCPYCGVGCGVNVSPSKDALPVIAGDTAHPANKGRLCLKGKSLGETVSLDDRLLYPEINGQRTGWDEVLDKISHTFKHCIDNYGPESVAFYVSGQLLTEDYYTVNKLVKGFLGTANIDTNSRLCMASSVAGHKRAFGSDTVPGCYEDIELANLVVLVGSNLAWCHPVLFNRLSDAKANNTNLQIINIDPRRTATADMSDVHLNIKADTDTILFNGLLKYLNDKGITDSAYVAGNTNGIEELLHAVESFDLQTVADSTGLQIEEVTAFYQRFAATERVVTIYSQGVNQSSCGTDKVNSIINCHLYTGRIGLPGCGPFSITGQPNAMGGRETGGLANMLTCHMELANPEHRALVQDFWQSPSIADKPGLTAVDLFNAVHQGKVRALWIMATNPVVSMPDAEFVKDALNRCEFVVQSDLVAENDTAEFANVRLPALGWGEKDGTVTNSERCISRQRRFINPPGEAKPDWWAVASVANRLGHTEEFNYQHPADIFTEFATLSGVNNQGERDFDISAYSDITHSEYEKLEPFYWPARAGQTGNTKPIRFFSDGRFFTSDKKAQFVIPEPVPADVSNGPGTFRLNTGRSRDQWHTMTRTGRAPTLSNHCAEPYLEIHPDDATDAGLTSTDIARVNGAAGSFLARVVVTDRVMPGHLFSPMHWCKPFAVESLINSTTVGIVDPVSKQPALKHAFVQVRREPISHFGFAVTTEPLNCKELDYVAKVRCGGGWRTEFGIKNHQEVQELAGKLLKTAGTEEVRYVDKRLDRYSFLSFDNDKLISAILIDCKPVSASRNWMAGLLNIKHAPSSRHKLLAGVKADSESDTGTLVCSCLMIGKNSIEKAIAEGCCTIGEVGKVTGAGTNCGSCRSEIAAIIRQYACREVA